MWVLSSAFCLPWLVILTTEGKAWSGQDLPSSLFTVSTAGMKEFSALSMPPGENFNGELNLAVPDSFFVSCKHLQNVYMNKSLLILSSWLNHHNHIFLVC